MPTESDEKWPLVETSYVLLGVTTASNENETRGFLNSLTRGPPTFNFEMKR